MFDSASEDVADKQAYVTDKYVNLPNSTKIIHANAECLNWI